MIDIEGPDSPLAKVDSAGISKPGAPLSIAQLEHALLERFPRDSAEPWDRTGLLAGDPTRLVGGVAVALDPTREAVEAAMRAEANVLLTHHPAFLDPPACFSPAYDRASASGVAVYTAIAHDVALMNFHTALDVSAEATRLLPRLLNFDFERLLVPLPGHVGKGYGQLCRVRAAEAPFKLAHLAARCVSVFGRSPRVWGDFSDVVSTVVVANGSAGNVVDACLAERVDCLVCGELRYHSALDARQAGLDIVEIGHDASELPLVALLAQAVVDAGVPQSRVTVIDQSGNWREPDSTRI